MTDIELVILVFRSLQIACVASMIFWVSPLFAYEAWAQFEEWRSVRYAERHKRKKDAIDPFFSELVEINRGRPKKAPKHRLQPKTEA
jgi:hypothetical protein